MIFKKAFFFSLFTLLSFLAVAQQQFNINSYLWNHKLVDIDSVGSNEFVNVQPILISKQDRDLLFDTEEALNFLNWQPFKNSSVLHDVTLNPLLDISVNGDNENLWMNYGAGLQLDGFIGEKWFVNAQYLYLDEEFPEFYSSKIEEFGVVPSVGWAHINSDRNRSHLLNTYVSFKPDEVFNFTLGYGKHQWGEGYRSMFLSDASNPYQYARLDVKFWRLQFQSLFTGMKDYYGLDNAPDNYRKKYTATQFININISKRVRFTFFEGVAWKYDSISNRGFDIHYLNPIVFYRPVEFELGSPDNMILGFGGSVKIGKHWKTYGQLVLDEFKLDELKSGNGWWANKYSIQAGLKNYKLFNVEGLFARTEFNYIRPYMYQHRESAESWSNKNLGLAHPGGANLYEVIAQASYGHKKWRYSGFINYLYQGLDVNDTTNYGANTLKSYETREQDYGNTVGQGVLHKTITLQGKAAYMLNDRNNLCLEFSALYRREAFQDVVNQDIWVNLGIRTSIFNRYFDY